MFVGHFAASFVAKRLDPRVPLAALFLAAQLVDVAWALFVISGIEEIRITPGITATNGLDLVYVPWSHSLVATFGWLVASAGAWYALRPRDGARAAWIFGAVVASHWGFDFLVHRPDLPLTPDGVKVGLGLWNHREVALGIELAMLVAAAYWWAGRIARPPVAWGFIAVLVVLQILFVYGPQPKTPTEQVLAALVSYAVLSAMATWVERRAGPARVGASPRTPG